MQQRDSYNRTSFSAVQGSIGFRDILWLFIPYGVSSVRVSLEFDSQFKHVFCHQKKWMNKRNYKQLSELSGSLPGPTPAQILIAVASIVSRSALGGFISFLLYCLPSALVLSMIAEVTMNQEIKGWLFGQACSYWKAQSEDEKKELAGLLWTYGKLILLGFQAGSSAVILKNIYTQYQLLHETNIFSALLVLVVGFLMSYYKSEYVLKGCVAMGLIMSMYVKLSGKKPMSMQQRSLIKNLERQSWLFGNCAIYLYILTLILLWILQSVYPHPLLKTAWQYFFIGTLTYGTGHSVFAMLYVYLSSTVPTSAFWMSLPLALMLPGPSSNVCVYVAYLTSGPSGACIAWFFYYLPSFLSIYGFLPKWFVLRESEAIQRFSIGMQCINLGLMLFAVPTVLLEVGGADITLTMLVFAVCFVVNYSYDGQYMLVILLGGLLANLRRWAVLYYREGVYKLNE